MTEHFVFKYSSDGTSYIIAIYNILCLRILEVDNELTAANVKKY
jgi:hypothetical protein